MRHNGTYRGGFISRPYDANGTSSSASVTPRPKKNACLPDTEFHFSSGNSCFLQPGSRVARIPAVLENQLVLCFAHINFIGANRK